MKNNWQPISDLPKDGYGFIWINRPSGVELAFQCYTSIQDAYSAGDVEGLSVDMIDDATHFMELETPSFP